MFGECSRRPVEEKALRLRVAEWKVPFVLLTRAPFLPGSNKPAALQLAPARPMFTLAEEAPLSLSAAQF